MAELIEHNFDISIIEPEEFYKIFLSGPNDQEQMKKAAIVDNYVEAFNMLNNNKKWLKRHNAKNPTVRIYALLHQFGDTRMGFRMFIDARRDIRTSIRNEMIKVVPCHLINELVHVYLTEARPLVMMYAN